MGSTAGASEMLFEECSQLGFAQRPHLGGFDFAILEQDQRRYPTNAIPGRRRRILINVQFRHFQTTVVFAGDFCKNRSDHLAGTTPLRPVIHQNGKIGPNHVFLEARIRDLLNVLAHTATPYTRARQAMSEISR